MTLTFQSPTGAEPDQLSGYEISGAKVTSNEGGVDRQATGAFFRKEAKSLKWLRLGPPALGQRHGS
jgi:hypothetical protein